MSDMDSDLHDDLAAEAPPKKGGIPKWALFGCGGGCLVFTMLLIAGGLLLYTNVIKDSANPDVQWPRLQEVVHFEERPANLKLMTGLNLSFFAGMEQFILMDSTAKLQVNVYDLRKQEVLKALMGQIAGSQFGQPDDPEEGFLDLQGREVEILRFSGVRGIPEPGLGPGVRVNISDRQRLRIVEIRRTHAGEALTDEEVQAFFDIFDVWAE